MSQWKGSALTGGSGDREREPEDYYATPYSTTQALLEVLPPLSGKILEPCVGGGHIARTIQEAYPEVEIKGYDLVNRGFEGTVLTDFLTHGFNETFDHVITNPPYSLAQPFLEKSLSLTKKGGVVAMFLKIQFLEGAKRKELFKKHPPKYIYVFSKRQNPWRNGNQLDEKGKPWSSTMCFAWFVWEQGFKGETVIRWL